jgi:hypothetical protein
MIECETVHVSDFECRLGFLYLLVGTFDNTFDNVARAKCRKFCCSWGVAKVYLSVSLHYIQQNVDAGHNVFFQGVIQLVVRLR